jgi:hypothetical protein
VYMKPLPSNDRGDMHTDTQKVGYQQMNCWRWCFLCGPAQSYIVRTTLCSVLWLAVSHSTQKPRCWNTYEGRFWS